MRPPKPSASPLRTLDSPVSLLAGVGPERAAQLRRLEIVSVRDLLLTAPRRYEDRRQITPIRELVTGTPSAVVGRIIAAGTNYFRQRTRSVFEIVLEDGSARLHCRWWNVPYLERIFAVGQEIMAYGKCISLRPRTMDHPETEILEAGEDATIHVQRIVPIYPLTEGLAQRTLRTLTWRALQEFGDQFVEPEPALVPLRSSETSEWVPTDLEVAVNARGIRWPTRAQAVRHLHFPPALPEADLARRRLALDEFIALQTEIQRRRQALESHATPQPCPGDNSLIRPFLARLGFRLTDAQSRVLKEIRTDLGGRVPMRRLLQGDVGAGKTAVAACAALMVLESGRNVALMAPTEILAEQHFQTFGRWFSPLGIRVELRTGSQRTSSTPAATPGAAPRVLTLGTHALLEADVELPELGLVIIDEQHKFGVAQRERLLRKGSYPHLLVMTATPIPRTLGLTLYGDLDVSVLDQLPPGRGRVRTHVREVTALARVWEFVRRELDAGRQAYVVYPRVVESDHQEVKAVTREFERLSTTLAPHSVGLVHGKLRSEEKERVMEAFRAGTIKVLLATSLIEVGVDVPNATLMIVENAEQFGLAQLHQLRGRIGRGGHDSHCILVARATTEEAQERLRILASTQDGFAIAEADLRLRGPGELTGQQQSGLPPFRFGDLRYDRSLLELARELVQAHLRATPTPTPPSASPPSGV